MRPSARGYLATLVGMLLLSACKATPTVTPTPTLTLTFTPAPTLTPSPTQTPTLDVLAGAVLTVNDFPKGFVALTVSDRAKLRLSDQDIARAFGSPLIEARPH